MRYLRKIQLTSIAIGFGLIATAAGAQPPNKQQLRKQILEAQKKADEQKKREDDRAKAEKQKVELAKNEKGTKPEKFTPAKIGDATAVAALIDREIDAKLTAQKAPAGALSTDAEFLRRAYLDLTGVIPTVSQARAFLDDPSEGKRAKLIDELLASEKFGRHVSDVWMGLLVTRTSDQRRISFEPLRDWLATQFNKNRPWNQIASDLIAAEGTQEKNPAVTFYLSNNTVDKMTDAVSKTFLGVSIQCAQCHDHKFEDWKQTEYWSLAQFFMRVEVQGAGMANKIGDPAVNEVKNPNRRRLPLPEDAKTVPVRYLRDTTPISLPNDGPILPTLAKWVTSPTNPYFAKSMTNRVWAQLFGTGIVTPVDDMGPNAIASHPKLLNSLAGNFAADKFDLKNLIREIMLSKTYQRSGKPTGGEGDEDPRLFARMAVKVMTPEQLYDSTYSVIGAPAAAAQAMRKGPLAGKGPMAPDGRERFVNFFLAGQEMANTTEYEVGIPQALKLMNSRQTGNPAAAKRLVGSKTGNAAIEELYLATLSRKPTSDEMTKMTSHLKSSTNADAGMGDILWALLNCSEFTLVR